MTTPEDGRQRTGRSGRFLLVGRRGVLDGLIDLARLDAGVLEPEDAALALGELFESMQSQFAFWRKVGACDYAFGHAAGDPQ